MKGEVISFRAKETVVKAADEEAKKLGMNRSEFILFLIASYILNRNNATKDRDTK